MTITAVEIKDRVIAININQTYEEGMSGERLYECTRGIWRLKRERAEKAQYAFAVFQGVIKEVYEIEQWHPELSTRYKWRQFELSNSKQTKTRYEFTGRVASSVVRDRYVNRHLPERYFGNPIRYYNC